MKLSKLLPLTNSSIKDELNKAKGSPTYFIERYCKVLRNPSDGTPYINEGLIKTIPLDNAIKIFNRVLKPKFDNKFQVIINGNDDDYYKTTLLIFKIPKIPVNISRQTAVDVSSHPSIDLLLRTINSLGYYPAAIVLLTSDFQRTLRTYFNTELSGYGVDETVPYSTSKFKTHLNDESVNYICIGIEPKFDELVTIPDVIYHVAPVKFLDKIQSKGLIPKYQEKMSFHPDRIYCALDQSSANRIGGMLKNYINSTVAVLTIDGKALKQKGVKFFKDPNYNGGVFTHENIPPDLITSADPFDDGDD